MSALSPELLSAQYRHYEERLKSIFGFSQEFRVHPSDSPQRDDSGDPEGFAELERSLKQQFAQRETKLRARSFRGEPRRKRRRTEAGRAPASLGEACHALFWGQFRESFRVLAQKKEVPTVPRQTKLTCGSVGGATHGALRLQRIRERVREMRFNDERIALSVVQTNIMEAILRCASPLLYGDDSWDETLPDKLSFYGKESWPNGVLAGVPRRNGKSMVTSTSVAGIADIGASKPISVAIIAQTEKVAMYLLNAILQFFLTLPGNEERLMVNNKKCFYVQMKEFVGVETLKESMRRKHYNRIEAHACREQSVHGVTADIVVIDEAARADIAVIRSILPLLQIKGSFIIMISTIRGVKDWYTGIITKKDAELDQTFERIYINFHCDECRRNGVPARLCRCLDSLKAPWISSQNMQRISQLMSGSEFESQVQGVVSSEGAGALNVEHVEIFLRPRLNAARAVLELLEMKRDLETKGQNLRLSSRASFSWFQEGTDDGDSGDLKVIDAQIREATRHLRSVGTHILPSRQPTPVWTYIDPAGGGDSDHGRVSLVIQNNCIVIVGIGAWNSRDASVCIQRRLEYDKHLLNLAQLVPQHVLGIENNYGGNDTVQNQERSAKINGLDFTPLRNDEKKQGLCTTPMVKQTGLSILTSLLAEKRILISKDLFTVGHECEAKILLEFFDQLTRIRFEGASGKKITGKEHGKQDDIAIVLIIALYWTNYFVNKLK